MENQGKPPECIVVFSALLACLLWSTAFAGIKIGLKFASPLSFAGMRFILAGLLLVPFCGRRSHYFGTVWTHLWLILLLGFIQTSLLYGLFYTGMTMVSGATGAIVVGASPLFTAVTAHFLMKNDKITPYKMVSIALGIAGVGIISISREPWSFRGLKELIGILIIISGNVSAAIGNVIVARDRQNIHPIILNSAQIFSGGCFLLFISVFLEGVPNLVQPLTFYLVLLWLAVISAAAFSLWFILLKRPDVKVSELNIWKFVIPVSGALLSWVLLPDESPDIASVTGMIFVAFSIMTANLPQLCLFSRKK